ncbi:hypothetical protein [Azospirillum canadense]|uniref:hypothetical protein n=1 Tax=Azospirillum canadense TaxID=403962 RepID=UPI0022268B88|nr:hypothetical protein [Azospirillum canadense]MCW2238215.1 hypothetical protein [Azospirillum canadense]
MKRLWTIVECSIGSWTATVGLDLWSWCIGAGWDLRPSNFWIEIGPVYFDINHEEPWPADFESIPNFTTLLHRLVYGKLDVKFEIDINIWRIGVSMADPRDWGLYCGPLNVQIEYCKRYAEKR